jgi:O-antigen/teichoic acid export membrane protein
MSNTVDLESIPFSKHLSAMNVISLAVAHIDKVVVYYFLGPTQLAVYAFALAPIQRLRTPDQIIANIALPKFAAQSFCVLQKTLVRKVFLLSLFLIALVGTYIYIAPFLFTILLPKYTESVIYSQVLALSIISTSSILFTQALTAHSKTKELYIVKTIIPLLRVILFLVLLPLYGLWGIITALLISQAANFILLAVLFLKTKP